MEFTPTVNEAAEFFEISNDFSNPKEVVREAISNSFDANAKNMKIECYIDRSTGIDELIIEIEDDGDGMAEEDLKAFFGLGYSTRIQLDERGYNVSLSIGEKGHGTKVYFNGTERIIPSRPARTIRIPNSQGSGSSISNPWVRFR